VIANVILASLALLSVALLLWQWLVACRFPLHQRVSAATFAPDVTLLKPLKGCDAATEGCLRSWFTQQYAGQIQILFGVASAEDPVIAVVRRLQQEFPRLDAQLTVCGPLTGANAKVSKLAQLQPLAKYDVIVISDADVRVTPDFLTNLVAPLEIRNPNPEGRSKSEIPSPNGSSALDTSSIALVNCFYILANPTTAAMQCEAIAINADFWSQVLQSRSLRPLDFALGAVMAVRRQQLEEIGGFDGLKDCLADDYQLGNRIARRGYRLELSPVVVECCSEPMGWGAVWRHQLRWARTIRVCQPSPYFFSILSNPTLWPLLWLLVCRTPSALAFGGFALVIRVLVARHLQQRLTRSRAPFSGLWLAPLKDLLQFLLWVMAYAGNHVEWRGQRLHLRRDGTLVKT
jgi:ceramide glucosyltransferase